MSGNAFKIFETSIKGMNAIGGVWIIVLMSLISADVIGRECFGSPIRGVPEMVSISIVAIVFMQLAHTLWVGRITRNDAVLASLSRRSPKLGRLLNLLFYLTGSFVFGLLAITSWTYFKKSISIGEYIGALGDFVFPTWPVWGIIIIGSMMTCIAYGILVRDMISEIHRSKS